MDHPIQTKFANESNEEVEKLRKRNVYLTMALNILIVGYYIMDYRMSKLNNTVENYIFHMNFGISWLNNLYNFITSLFCCKIYNCKTTCGSAFHRSCKYCFKVHEIWYSLLFILPLLTEITITSSPLIIPLVSTKNDTEMIIFSVN